MGKLLSLDVITGAISGETEAVRTVLSHYSSYISSLSRRYGYCDVEAECRLESKLAEALLKFEINR